jgi:hypothetical protein
VHKVVLKHNIYGGHFVGRIIAKKIYEEGIIGRLSGVLIKGKWIRVLV